MGTVCGGLCLGRSKRRDVLSPDEAGAYEFLPGKAARIAAPPDARGPRKKGIGVSRVRFDWSHAVAAVKPFS